MAYLRRLILVLVFAISSLISLAAFANDQGEAYVECLQGEQAAAEPVTTNCYIPDGQSRYAFCVTSRMTGGSSCFFYPFAGTCADREPDYFEIEGSISPVTCSTGCSYVATDAEANGECPECIMSGTFTPTGDDCSTEEGDGGIDSDGDGVDDENDDFPSDPNETTDSDADGVGDNDDTSDEDADNGADNGSGDETDNQSSGGGTCGEAPACSGDSIQCNILFQQWKTRCAAEAGTTAKTSTGGSDCTAAPVSSGDAIEANIALQTWKTRCAAEALGEGITAQTELLAGAYGADESGLGQGTDYTGPDAWAEAESEEEEVTLDDSGWLSDRSCPEVPDVDVFGETLQFDITTFCDFLSIGAGLVLVFAQIACMRLIGTAI